MVQRQMKLGDEVWIHGYVDEIRKDVVVIRNDGGYFGTVESEISEQPTLYDYKIEHLALIARVMEKEGITPEKAVETFGDIVRIANMLIEEIQNKVNKEIESWGT